MKGLSDGGSTNPQRFGEVFLCEFFSGIQAAGKDSVS